jgi:DeoR/GlpR family transcriptional regulator of sugar metabolism
MSSRTASSPRFTAERHARILERLRSRGRVEVLELARSLRVSEHTVRRDLLALQAKGVLQRTHGGAVTLDTARLDLRERAAVLPQAKQAIGRAAANLLEPGQSVILDAGTTTLAMAREITVRPLTVITNSLDIAAVFADDPQVQLVVTGGQWQRHARAMWGAAALEALHQCRADWAVPGACALHAELGMMASDEPDAQVKRAMVASARRTLVLADHSKLDGVAPFLVVGWQNVHTLVTDEPAPELAALGVNVVVAHADGALDRKKA